MVCPVCNGLRPLGADCPACGESMVDEGKWTDLLGPYAPYEPTGLSPEMCVSGMLACVHTGYCPGCGNRSEIPVPELP